jgi:HEAT repeat protein
MFTDADKEKRLAEWLDQLQDPDPARRRHAAAALSARGRRAAEAVPGLVGLLRDPDEYVRRMAALALGEIGARPDLAVPALQGALSDGSEGVRRRAAVALRELGVPEARAAA